MTRGIHLYIGQNLNVGYRLAPAKKGEDTHWPNGRLRRGTVRNKLARRIMRARAFRQDSSIEMAIVKARLLKHEAQSLATNSHEAKRYIAALRKEAER